MLEDAPLTPADEEKIVNKIAWRTQAEEEIISLDYGLDYDTLDRIMRRHGYEFDPSQGRWVSTRRIWKRWDGELPKPGNGNEWYGWNGH